MHSRQITPDSSSSCTSNASHHPTAVGTLTTADRSALMTKRMRVGTANGSIDRGMFVLPPTRTAGAAGSSGTTLAAAAQSDVIDGPAGRPERQRSIRKPTALGI